MARNLVYFHMVFAIGLFVANLFIYQLVFVKPELRIDVLAAGKGNAVLVRAPGGATMLYGAGSDASIVRALGETLPESDRHIDLLVDASAVPAEAGGLPFLRQRYSIGQEISATSSIRGARIELGGGAYADVLYPDRDASRMSAANAALVLALHYKLHTILLEGTAPAPILSWLGLLDKNSGELAADLVISSSTLPSVYRY